MQSKSRVKRESLDCAGTREVVIPAKANRSILGVSAKYSLGLIPDGWVGMKAICENKIY